jgi:DNA invertase Pin-like site-specific DNA recombinase/transposase
VAIYVRVSTREQVKGYGLKVQEDGCIAWLNAMLRGNFVIVDVYKDAGVSGKKSSRPHFDRLNRDVKDRKIDMVIAHKLDRVGRTMRDIQRWVWNLLDEKIRFVAVSQGLDSDTETGQLQISLFAWLAEIEHGLILSRTMDGRENKLAAGGWPSGLVPYGYAIEGKGKEAVVVLCEDEVSVIEYAVHVAVDEKHNWEDVARLLNEKKMRRRFGKPWTGNMVRQILGHTAILEGKAYFRKTGPGTRTKLDEDGLPLYGDTVAIELPRILSEERAAALAKIIKDRARFHSPDAKYPLSRRINGSCGEVYVGSGVEDHRMYRCNGNHRETPCGDAYLDADALEAAVWDELADFLTDPSRLQALAEQYIESLPGAQSDHEERLASLKDQVDEKESALATAIITCATLKLDEEAAKKATSQLDTDLAVLRATLAEAEEWQEEHAAAQAQARDLITLIEKARGKLASLSLGTQGEIFEMLDIQVHPESHGFQKRSGIRCSVRAWHVEKEVLVPAAPNDEDWAAVMEILSRRFPEIARSRSDPRKLFCGMLHRLRTGETWEAMDKHWGSTANLKRYQSLWFKSGAWKEMLLVLPKDGAKPVFQPRVIPKLRVTGVVRRSVYDPSAAVAEPSDGPTDSSATVRSGEGLAFVLAAA